MDFVWVADWHAQKANHFRGFVIFSPYYTSIIHAPAAKYNFLSSWNKIIQYKWKTLRAIYLLIFLDIVKETLWGCGCVQSYHVIGLNTRTPMNSIRNYILIYQVGKLDFSVIKRYEKYVVARGCTVKWWRDDVGRAHHGQSL